MKTIEIRHKRRMSTDLALIVTLGGVAMLSGFLVVMVYQLTKPVIAENQRRAEARAISQVIPGAVSSRAFILKGDRLIPAGRRPQGEVIYAGYDRKGRLAGIAAKARAQGYADIIYLLYGYDPQCACIRGVHVLKMAETPGLGDKIRTDPEFLKNFQALDASLDAEGKALQNPIVTVKHGRKRNPWEIDAISGATISSRAVGRALNASASRILPRLRPHIDALRRAGPPERKGGKKQ